MKMFLATVVLLLAAGAALAQPPGRRGGGEGGFRGPGGPMQGGPMMPGGPMMMQGGPMMPGGPMMMQGGPMMQRGGRGDRGGPGGGAPGSGRGGFGRGGGRGGPGGGPGGDDRASRLEGMLRSMDANRNGTLEPSEVPEDRKRMLTFIAGRAGLDPEKPIEIGTIREKLAGGGQEQNPSGNDDKKDSKPDEKKNEDPLVPGFGVAQELPRVPRFGERVPIASVTTSASSSRRSEDPRGRDSDRSREDRMRQYAQFMLRRYDENNSGSLEKDEWDRLRERGRNPQEYDRNNDGVITAEEMADQMGQFGRGGGPRSDSNGSEGSRDSDSDQSTSYRFLTASERLPSDIPDWFVDQDENGDGQVAMAEYTSFWSDSKVREFARYDLNRDGLITATECLAAPFESDEDDKSNEASQEGEGAAAQRDGDKSDKASVGGGGGGGGGDKPWWMN